MNPAKKSFSSSSEILQGCSLSMPITEAQARALAGMLVGSEPWLTLKFSAAALAGYLTRADDALRRYAVLVNDELAGVICVRHPWLRGPYIELLGLFPEYRGKGIGRTLLAWAEAEARQDSKNLWVLTSSFNHQALAFYQSMDFQPIGPIPGLVTPEHDEILLRKHLA